MDIPGFSYTYINNKFDNFDAFADAIRAWDLDFRQLDRGQSSAFFTQLIADDIHLTHARLNRHYHQRGSTPAKLRTFAVLEERVSGVNWFGREFNASSIACFPANGELEAVSRPDFEVYTLSICEESLNNAAVVLELPGLDSILSKQDTLANCNPFAVHSIRLLARKINRLAQQPPNLSNQAALKAMLNKELPQLLIKAISESQEIAQSNPGQWKKRQALKKTLDYLNAASNEPVSVQALCEHSKVSNRTMEQAFKDYFGVSPKSYLKATRLNGAHKDLLNNRMHQRSITDIANHWGFWHMGQFAADYKIQYGELPSDTIKK